MKKVLIIAGGTGGHIFPALAVAEQLQKQGVAIEWMGTEVGMEKKIVADRFPMHFLPVKALRGKSIITKLASPVRLLKAVFQAFFLIKKINPDVALGMGGYASGPAGVAAWLCRVPLVIHEQNARAGLTNRLLTHFATLTLQAFPNAFSKAQTVGNPVRESIIKARKTDDYYLTREKPWRILVLGGSQGSSTINQLIPNWLKHTHNQNDFVIWHQTGQRDFEKTQQNYTRACGQIASLRQNSLIFEDRSAVDMLVNEQRTTENQRISPKIVDLSTRSSVSAPLFRIAPFIDDMCEAYQWADIVICRSGALTVSEIAAVGLPAIFIPYPFAADDHQYFNAEYLSDKNAGIVIRESILTPEKLDESIQVLTHPTKELQQRSNQAKICAKLDAVSEIIKGISRVA